MHIFLLKTTANFIIIITWFLQRQFKGSSRRHFVLILQLLALIVVVFSSKGSQKLSVCLYVCLCVNQGGTNHNHYT